ncbi:hypothetical protein BJ122_105109 [Rhodopseudomonas faecalis]|uniref:Uncharacterized protein n=1 Tax=Rhodopseudomonas faecalis TaxID=99655 RepID=A0A318TG26_9BRAD|nr:hypothetical protein [Rhodopseudomonas faecalis]PYF03852.1 hypothetical protein BJ122_105109 [Rhodopseudomonas faecalis]
MTNENEDDGQAQTLSVQEQLIAARAEGAREVMGRLTAAIGADEVKRHPLRLAAAVDLLTRAPDMPGEAIAAFVVNNIAAANPQETASDGYAARRAAMHVAWTRPEAAKPDRVLPTSDEATGD